MKRWCLLVAFLATFLSTPRVGIPQTPPTVTIGIVVDGPWSGNEGVIRLFREEIIDLLIGEFDP